MEFKPPTFEEYKNATNFARFKFKYGLVINIISILLFILLIFFMVYYAKEISEHPFLIGAKKYNVECNCHNLDGRNIYFNSTDIIFKQKYGG